jgi:hypothetical protein
MEFWPLKTLSEVSGVLLGLQLSPTPNVGVHLGVWGFTPSHSLHSWEHVIWLPGLLIGPHLATPLLWSQAKARVATVGAAIQMAVLLSRMHFPFIHTRGENPWQTCVVTNIIHCCTLLSSSLNSQSSNRELICRLCRLALDTHTVPP